MVDKEKYDAIIASSSHTPVRCDVVWLSNWGGWGWSTCGEMMSASIVEGNGMGYRFPGSGWRLIRRMVDLS